MADENTLKSLNTLTELDGSSDIMHIYDMSASQDMKITVNSLIEKSTIPETYQTKLTTDELAAADSGITAEKVTKLDGIAEGAEVNVQADWDQTDTTAEDYIKNKPAGLTVVDVVEDGNMNAVTSNAVNDTLTNYPPVGSVLAFAGSSAPSGWLLCDGTEVSQTTYAKLYSVIGDTYGTATTSGMFVLPNLCECTIVGAGTSSRTSSDTVPLVTHNAVELGEFQDDEFKSHHHKLLAYTGSSTGISNVYGGSVTASNQRASASSYLDNTYYGSSVGQYIQDTGGTTTHDKRVGMNYIIRY